MEDTAKRTSSIHVVEKRTSSIYVVEKRVHSTMSSSRTKSSIRPSVRDAEKWRSGKLEKRRSGEAE
jgi:hypothetical protein